MSLTQSGMISISVLFRRGASIEIQGASRLCYPRVLFKQRTQRLIRCLIRLFEKDETDPDVWPHSGSASQD